jgi:SAM-dependent methyltransferase
MEFITTMNVNFRLTATDYAKHRAGFPDAFFERVFNEGIIRTDDILIDLGTGTGTLARGFAERGCKVTGIDISAQMLEQAKDLSQQAGLEVDFRFAKAEATGLPDGYFDVVTAGQCWHWFDRPNAALEVKRILKPNGHVLIAHFDWLPLEGNVVDLTEKLIQTYNPKWYAEFGGKTGLYSEWPRDLGEAGFLDIQTFHSIWMCHIPTKPGVDASARARGWGQVCRMRRLVDSTRS